MKMKKLLAIVALTALTTLTLTGCESYASYTFNVEDSDQIKVQLDTSNGEKLSQEDGMFIVSSEDDTPISAGMFQPNEVMTELFDTIAPSDNLEIIEESLESDPEYILYEYTDENDKSIWNYIIRFDDTKSGIAITNETSEESAKEAFELLTFEVNPD